jgi:4-amino-4-deoxy-L-arabinose transferase-like glycosyltransferase
MRRHRAYDCRGAERVSSTSPPRHTSPELRLLLILVAVAAAARLATLGMYPLMDTTEARYAEIGRRMAELGDWITPWINDGEPFWGKPPFSFWMTAGSFKLLGIGAFTARLPHWIGGVLVAWLLWGWADRRSRREAVYAVVLASGSALFFAASGAVMTDMALALGLTMAMRGFWLREDWLLIFGIAIGLLAKGPLALVLAGLPVVAWAIATGNLRRAFVESPWPKVVPWVLALVLPWYALAEWKTPGFLEYFLVGEHWLRYTVSGWSGDLYGHSHAFPRGTIWLFAVLALLPWSVLLPVAAWRWRHLAVPATPADQSLVVYLACWALAPCVLFTLSGNILWTYVLPGLPAAAMLATLWLARLPAGLVERRLLAGGVALTSLVGLGLVVAFNAGGWDDETSTQSLVREYEARRAGGEALIFYRKRPLSGSFYSDGQAEQVLSLDEMHARLALGPAWVAVKERHRGRVSGHLFGTLQPVDHIGEYDLYYLGPDSRRALAPLRHAQ